MSRHVQTRLRKRDATPDLSRGHRRAREWLTPRRSGEDETRQARPRRRQREEGGETHHVVLLQAAVAREGAGGEAVRRRRR